MEVPKWFDNPDIPKPCPCGRPAHGPMVLAETERGEKIMLHEACAAKLEG